MSTVRQVIMEAETVSAREFIRAVMGEEGLRAAARAAARQEAARRPLVSPYVRLVSPYVRLVENPASDSTIGIPRIAGVRPRPGRSG